MLRNQMLSFLKSASSIVLVGGAFCCWILLCVWAIGYFNGDTNVLGIFTDSTVVATSDVSETTPQVKVTNELRYTTMGWQTPSHWMRQPTQVSQLSVAELNPVLLALIFLLASLLAVLLYTPEEEVDRMLMSGKLKRKEVVAIKLNKLRN